MWCGVFHCPGDLLRQGVAGNPWVPPSSCRAFAVEELSCSPQTGGTRLTMWHLFCQSHLSTRPVLTARPGEWWEAASWALSCPPKLHPPGPQGQPSVSSVWAGRTDLLRRFHGPQLFPSSKDKQLCCLLPGLLLQLLLLMAGVVNSNDRGHVLIVPRSGTTANKAPLCVMGAHPPRG